jgi:hypothetical protein
VKQLNLSVAADADLFDILAYGTAVHGEAASDAYYAGLSEAFAFLYKFHLCVLAIKLKSCRWPG